LTGYASHEEESVAEPFLGQIIMTGFNWPPRGWALCDGQIMSIAQNTALFSLLGTTYGGDGRVTFALPDLRGRASLHQGQGPGLTNRTIGEVSGEESVTLIVNQTPAHSHQVHASDVAGDAGNPSGAVPAAESAGATATYTKGNPDVVMNPLMIGPSGGSQPHDNMQPYTVVSFCIALEGIYPSRN
jgi:microcystin-dependent protein